TRVFADRRMRTPAGLDSHYPLRNQGAGAREEFGVFLRVDVVGDGGDVVNLRHELAEALGQGCLAGAYGAANPNTQRACPGRARGGIECGCHDRKSLVYWVSW